jgi:hypothetical protein
MRSELAFLLLPPLVGASLVVSCSAPGSSDSATDAGTAASDANDEMTDAHPGEGDAAGTDAGSFAAPQVVMQGGAVLASPSLAALTFDADTLRPQVESFATQLAASHYWKTVAGEYGVGPLSSLAPVRLADTAPAMISDTEIDAYLAAKLTAPDAGLAPSPSTVYALFFPSGTTITAVTNSSRPPATSCTGADGFGGYHKELTLGDGTKIVYAIIARCAGIDQVTGDASHEIVEAVTNPHPVTSPALVGVNAVGEGFALFLGGSEVMDMCSGSAKPYTTPADLPFVVQRGFSNRSAAAGHDPCLPADGAPYFNAVPLATDALAIAGSSQPALGVKTALGVARTIDVSVVADGTIGQEVAIVASDFYALTGQGAHVGVALDRQAAHPGDVLHLTVTPSTADPFGVEPVLFQSVLAGRETRWLLLVGQK